MSDTFTWVIPTLVSMFFVCLCGYCLFNTKQRRFDMAFLCLMGAGFVSYAPYYIGEHRVAEAIICDIVNLFQIVTINSNSYEEALPRLDSTLLYYICIFVRGAVHIGSPILGTVSAFNIISRQLQKWKATAVVKRSKKVYVFSCCNESAVKIAECIAEKQEPASFLFYETSRIDPELEEKLGHRRVSAIGQKMKIDMISRELPDASGSEIYYILTNDSDENIELGLMIEEHYRKKTDFTDNIHIAAFSENSSSDETVIDSIETKLDLRVVDRNRYFAYALLTDMPLYEAVRDGRLNILIVDFNKLAKEMLFAAIFCSQLIDAEVTISILTKDKAAAEAELELWYPELFLNRGYNIKFYPGTLSDAESREILKKHCIDTDYIILCGSDDNVNVRDAVMLRRFFLKSDGTFTRKPFIAMNIRSDKKSDVVKHSQYDIYPFGCDQQLYSYDEIVDPELESLSKRVHLAYYGTPTTEDRQAYLGNISAYYYQEYNRRSSLATAVSLKYMLWRMGFSAERCTGDEVPDMTELRAFIEETDLCPFAEAEHKRWMAYVRTEGTSVMTPEQASTIAHSAPELFLNRKTGNSVRLGMHIDLVPLDKIAGLTDEVNELCKDVIDDSKTPKPGTVRTKKDTTLTDEDIIRYLPDILGAPVWRGYTGGYLYRITKRGKEQ